jgi:hypothetical protein
MADLQVGQFGEMADVWVAQIDEWSQKTTLRTIWGRVFEGAGNRE